MHFGVKYIYFLFSKLLLLMIKKASWGSSFFFVTTIKKCYIFLSLSLSLSLSQLHVYMEYMTYLRLRYFIYIYIYMTWLSEPFTLILQYIGGVSINSLCGFCVGEWAVLSLCKEVKWGQWITFFLSNCQKPMSILAVGVHLYEYHCIMNGFKPNSIIVRRTHIQK